MDDLRRVVVDTETTGLDPAEHIAIEVAWWCLETGERGRFIPEHGDYDMDRATPEAMAVNRYWERGLDAPRRWDDGRELARFHAAIVGQQLVGSKPEFDAAMLAAPFRAAGLDREPWHYRLVDVGTVAMGQLGTRAPLSLARLCERLGVAPGDHTATGDVTAAGECLLELERRHARLIVIDPDSDDDVELLARASLMIPAGTKLHPGERKSARRLLAHLVKLRAS